MKRLKLALCVALCLAVGLTCLAGCAETETSGGDETGIITVANSPDETGAGDVNKTPLAEASDFTFDFENLSYAFTGVADADFYYIRVYPVVNGTESNSASFQSDKIEANDSNAYAGVIEGETLLAGEYVAHVVASGAGYSSSDAQTGGTSTLLAAAAVSATWNTSEDETPVVTADVSITAGDDITKSFTLVVTDENGSEVYKNAAAGAGTVNLTAADLGADVLTADDVYNVTVTVNEVAGYRLPAEGTTVQITQPRRFPF